ncbi:hypothetical protein IE53DRAFT_361271 [Violaceomyces palustris]|uniref:Uncharacterized protein n=1 Tax=Violaceomyces palustris TaxID=1673888 RepID=A0ACD0P165_9BASI|nr:hypothetical protein IE53DRAFT_361271 [Violaceomyces palustris]
MNVTISSTHVRTFTNALYCLSKFGDNFWLQASRQDDTSFQLRISIINSSNSAFCMFTFSQEFFILSKLEKKDRLECQLLLKSVLSVLKISGKTVEKCELDLIDDSEECRLVIRLHCQHGVLKTHKLTYEQKRGLLPTADPNPPNLLVIRAEAAHEWVEHFLSSGKNGEITIWCDDKFCVVKSKDEDGYTVGSDGKGQIRRSIQTEVRVDIQDFETYEISNESCLCFSLKEFRATIVLAEQLGRPLEISFSDGEAPLFVRIHQEAVEAEFVIATTKGERPQMPSAPQQGNFATTAAGEVSKHHPIAANYAGVEPGPSTGMQGGMHSATQSQNRSRANQINPATSSEQRLQESHPSRSHNLNAHSRGGGSLSELQRQQANALANSSRSTQINPIRDRNGKATVDPQDQACDQDDSIELGGREIENSAPPPTESRLLESSQHPMESTQRATRDLTGSTGMRNRSLPASPPQPLFLGTSQETGAPSQTQPMPSRTERGGREYEDSEEFGQGIDFDALDALESSIRNGETEMRGSQVVMRSRPAADEEAEEGQGENADHGSDGFLQEQEEIGPAKSRTRPYDVENDDNGEETDISIRLPKAAKALGKEDERGRGRGRERAGSSARARDQYELLGLDHDWEDARASRIARETVRRGRERNITDEESVPLATSQPAPPPPPLTSPRLEDGNFGRGESEASSRTSGDEGDEPFEGVEVVEPTPISKGGVSDDFSERLGSEDVGARRRTRRSRASTGDPDESLEGRREEPSNEARPGPGRKKFKPLY